MPSIMDHIDDKQRNRSLLSIMTQPQFESFLQTNMAQAEDGIHHYEITQEVTSITKRGG